MLYNFNPNPSAGSSSVISQSTPPTGVQVNQLWFDTSGKKLFYWSGSNWLSEQTYCLRAAAQSQTANSNVYLSPGRMVVPAEVGLGRNCEFVISQQTIAAYFQGGVSDAFNNWSLATDVMSNTGIQRSLTSQSLTGNANVWLSFLNIPSSFLPAVNPSSDVLVFHRTVKTGNPGTLFFSAATFFKVRLL